MSWILAGALLGGLLLLGGCARESTREIGTITVAFLEEDRIEVRIQATGFEEVLITGVRDSAWKFDKNSSTGYTAEFFYDLLVPGGNRCFFMADFRNLESEDVPATSFPLAIGENLQRSAYAWPLLKCYEVLNPLATELEKLRGNKEFQITDGVLVVRSHVDGKITGELQAKLSIHSYLSL
jgi:hypothetical protein